MSKDDKIANSIPFLPLRSYRITFPIPLAAVLDRQTTGAVMQA
jgi:hypothetical protein